MATPGGVTPGKRGCCQSSAYPPPPGWMSELWSLQDSSFCLPSAVSAFSVPPSVPLVPLSLKTQ